MKTYLKKVSHTLLLGLTILLILTVIYLVYPIRFPRHQVQNPYLGRIDIKKELGLTKDGRIDIAHELGLEP